MSSEGYTIIKSVDDLTPAERERFEALQEEIIEALERSDKPGITIEPSRWWAIKSLMGWPFPRWFKAACKIAFWVYCMATVCLATWCFGVIVNGYSSRADGIELGAFINFRFAKIIMRYEIAATSFFIMILLALCLINLIVTNFFHRCSPEVTSYTN